VEGRQVHMEFENGYGVSTLRVSDYEKYLSHLYILQSTCYAPTGDIVVPKPKGLVWLLVTFRGRIERLRPIVIDEHDIPLFGRESAFNFDMSTITAVNHLSLHDLSSLLDRYQDIFDSSLVTLQMVKKQLQQDPALKLVYYATVTGWPRAGPLSPAVQDYYRCRHELSTDECLLRGT